ncbi:MAG: ABC transporter permease [Actinobacteria bacterium]|nr:ABC transporter permease [Actinomycetota bacterium]MDQ3533023.1 ABC transporter permease [Actinomycetota bacterium]
MTIEQLDARKSARADSADSAGGARRRYAQEVLALARRWWIELLRERLNLVFSLAQPAIWLVFFGAGVERAIDTEVIGTDDYIGFMLAGIVTFTIVGNGVSGAMPLLWDKETGYLDRLMSMPIARSSVIVSRFVFQVVQQSAQILLVVSVALVLGVRIATGPLGLLVILLTAALLTMSVTAAFSALAYAVPQHGTFFAVAGFVSLPLLFMSNAFVPLGAMPAWMEVVARLNPLTYAIEAMRTLVLDGWEPRVAASLAVLALAGVVCLALGTWQFRKQTGERVRG